MQHAWDNFSIVVRKLLKISHMKQSIILGIARKEKNCKKYICKLVYLRQLFTTSWIFAHEAEGRRTIHWLTHAVSGPPNAHVFNTFDSTRRGALHFHQGPAGPLTRPPFAAGQTQASQSRILHHGRDGHYQEIQQPMGFAVTHGAQAVRWLETVWRLPPPQRCNDTRPLPGPTCSWFLRQLCHGAHFFQVDLVQGYHQITIATEDIPKTTVITPFGLFEYLCMPFGLKNAAQTFQRLMDTVCRGLDFVFVYLDDILIASQSESDHLAHPPPTVHASATARFSGQRR